MSTVMAAQVDIQSDQEIPTWFGIGGRAKRLARPRNLEELRACVEIDPNLRILGDGANLLVADEGVSELVVTTKQGDFEKFTIGQTDSRGNVIVTAGAGVHLFKLINATVDAGLTGLENLAGIPACVGGAAIMNAGGKYGSTGDYVAAVYGVDRAGKLVSLKRPQIEFTYRHSSLSQHEGKELIISSVDFKLKRADMSAVKAKLKEVTEYKKSTQPLNANSAGCCFKNPTLMDAVRDIGTPGTRVSAGMLIDRAGCKGMKVGGATVSDQHGNFIVAGPGCTATDVLTLMRQVRDKVRETFKVTIEPEVVIWGAQF